MNKYPEPTVSAVIFNPAGKILLCKSHKWGNKYVIPGGHIELGEKGEYEWVDIEQIEYYDLGGFTKELLMKVRNKDESQNSTKIFYNY